MKFFTTAIFAVLAGSVAADYDIKEKLRQYRDPANVKRENVVEFLSDRHEHRMRKLEELLADRKQQIEHHNSGHRRLNAEDHERVTRQARNFERKLIQMQNIDPQEHAEMLQHEADAFYRLNSVDYLDFPGVNKNN